MLELTETLKACLWQTAKTLKGTQWRRFMAQIVQELGTGGQRQAQTELGWCRDTIRKGQRELETGLSLYRCLQGQRPKTSGKQRDKLSRNPGQSIEKQSNFWRRNEVN